MVVHLSLCDAPKLLISIQTTSIIVHQPLRVVFEFMPTCIPEEKPSISSKVEVHDVRKEMELDLLKQYSQVERIFADRISKTSGDDIIPEYLVKWQGLSYAEATWERDTDIIFAQNAIDEYKVIGNSVALSLGLATTLAILGIVTSFTGKAFGQIGQGFPLATSGLAVVMGLNLMEDMFNLIESLETVHLKDKEDRLFWLPESKEEFSVSFCYNNMRNQAVRHSSSQTTIIVGAQTP